MLIKRIVPIDFKYFYITGKLTFEKPCNNTTKKIIIM